MDLLYLRDQVGQIGDFVEARLGDMSDFEGIAREEEWVDVGSQP